MAMERRNYLQYTSWPIFAAMVTLMLVGVLAIRASEQVGAAPKGYTLKQIIFSVLAIGAFLAATAVPYTRIGRKAYAIFGGVLGLLVLVLFLPAIRGSHRWIDLGPVYFQPAEAAKLAYVLAMAWYLRYGDHYRRLGGLLIPFVLAFVPMGLILKEPDLGTSLLFVPTFYVMLFMAGARKRHLIGIMVAGTFLLLLPVPSRLPVAPVAPAVPAAAMVAESRQRTDYERAVGEYRQARRAHAEGVEATLAMAYGSFSVAEADYAVMATPLLLMEPHQLERVEGWLRQGDPRISRTIGYQLHKSKLILGGGGWIGHGDWNREHEFFRMLPDDHTDFIFAVIGGRWGFAGCVMVILLYAVIVLFGLEIASGTDDPFGRLLAVGIVTLMAAQVLINVGMTMGLMPITGMTLPLVSYGGSSLVVSAMALGLLVNVGQHRPRSLARKPFEHGRREARGDRPSESIASPRRSASSKINLAGGSCS